MAANIPSITFPYNQPDNFSLVGSGNIIRFTYYKTNVNQPPQVQWSADISGYIFPSGTGYTGAIGSRNAYFPPELSWHQFNNTEYFSLKSFNLSEDTHAHIITVDYEIGPGSGVTNYPFNFGINWKFYYTAFGLIDGGIYNFTMKNQIPLITQDPLSANKQLGESITFTVVAESYTPMTYQWQKDGVNIVGATSDTYTIPVIGVGDLSHNYRVIVTNDIGGAISAQARLRTGSGPFIYTNPASATKFTGDTYTFSVVATGSGNLSYQWYKDGTEITGATSDRYYIQSIQVSDMGVYKVEVSDLTGSNFSDEANLLVNNRQRYQDSNYYVSGYFPSGVFNHIDSGIPVPLGIDSNFWPSGFFDTIYRADAKDVVITDASGNLLPREITYYNKVQKKLSLWFKTGSVTPSGLNPFYVQWGGSGVIVQNDPNTWKNNYSGGFDHRFVCHFDNNLTDSVNGNNGYGWRNQWSWLSPNLIEWVDHTQNDDLIFINEMPRPPAKFTQGILLNDWYAISWVDPRPEYVHPGLGYIRVDNDPNLSFGDGNTDQPLTIRAWINNLGMSFNHTYWEDFPIVNKGHWSHMGEYYFGTIGKHLALLTFDSSPETGLDWAQQGVQTTGTLTGSGIEGHYAATYTGTSGVYKLYINGTDLETESLNGTHGYGIYKATNHWVDTPVPSGVDYDLGGISTGYMEDRYILRDGSMEIGRYNMLDFPSMRYRHAFNTIFDEFIMLGGALTPDQMAMQHRIENDINSHASTAFTTSSGVSWGATPYIPPSASGAPTIMLNPTDLTVSLGTDAQFYGNAVGPGTINYQWYKGSDQLLGENKYYLYIPRATTSNIGDYHFVAYNSWGMTQSTSARLNVTTNSGIINPSGEINPGNSGVIPSGTVSSGVIMPPDYVYVSSGVIMPPGYVYASGNYKFIDKNFTGTYPSQATEIYNMNLGNLFYSDEKADKFLFGNVSDQERDFILFVGGLNLEILPNAKLSLYNSGDWESMVNFHLKPNTMQLVQIKYDVPENPDLGYGTLQILVAEKLNV